MIMVHGDDHGLRVPPRLAPTQVVVLVARAGEGVPDAARTIVGDLERLGVRVELDERMELSLGRRIVDHELRGVPLRIELGPRDLAAAQAVVARRARGRKEALALRDVAGLVPQMLGEDQQALLDQATALRDRLTREAKTLQDAHDAAREGFARIAWRACGRDGEEQLAQAGISVRCLVREDGQPVEDPSADGVYALLARAY